MERRPRFVPTQVCAEHAAVLKLYRVHKVRGDAYSAGWIRDEFGRHWITYRPSSRNRSGIYLAALPALLAGRARLLDLPRLREQLTGLQRHVHAQGREEITHGGGANAHDDVANAAMGAIGLAADRSALQRDRVICGPIVFTRGGGRPWLGESDDAPIDTGMVYAGGSW